MTAKWTDFVAGSILTAAQLNDVLDNFSDIAMFNETQASGTNGGGATSGSFIKRTLNTTVVNNIAGCSIASSVITLAAGTYFIRATSPAYVVEKSQSRLRNTTDSTTAIVGGTQAPNATYFGWGDTSLVGYITIAATKNFELQMRVQNNRATDGLGPAANYGESEIYGQIQIVRVA
jgi:hypothetical protein